MRDAGGSTKEYGLCGNSTWRRINFPLARSSLPENFADDSMHSYAVKEYFVGRKVTARSLLANLLM